MGPWQTCVFITYLFVATSNQHLLVNLVAGCGKSIFWYVSPHIILTKRVHVAD